MCDLLRGDRLSTTPRRPRVPWKRETGRQCPRLDSIGGTMLLPVPPSPAWPMGLSRSALSANPTRSRQSRPAGTAGLRRGLAKASRLLGRLVPRPPLTVLPTSTPPLGAAAFSPTSASPRAALHTAS